jgi:hypothetical protein
MRLTNSFAIGAVIVLLVLLDYSLAAAQSQSQPQKEDDKWIIIEGWSVHGYAGGKEIGTDWYKTRVEADAAKARMEKVETTTGKYYDKVEIEAAPRRFRRNNDSKTRPQSPSSPNTALPKPGSSGSGTTIDERATTGQRNDPTRSETPSATKARSNADAATQSSDPSVVSVRDKDSGLRYETPNSDFEITIDGHKWIFKDRAAALDYANSHNVIPALADPPQTDDPQRSQQVAKSTPNHSEETHLDTNGTRWFSLNGDFFMQLNADGSATYFADGSPLRENGKTHWDINGAVLTVTYGEVTEPGSLTNQRVDRFTILGPRRLRLDAMHTNGGSAGYHEESLRNFKENDRIMEAK